MKQGRLANLKTHWEKALQLHSQISLVVTAEDWQTLPYFLNEEFFKAKDEYNETADFLHDAISSFVKIESSVNYISTWQLLLNEYDDKQALIHTHSHSFVSLQKIKTKNVTELKKLRDTVSVSLAALMNLGCLVSHWDDLLVYFISQKFSPRTRNEWSLKHCASTEIPSYKDLSEFLTQRIRGLSEFPDQYSVVSDNSQKNPAPLLTASR